MLVFTDDGVTVAVTLIGRERFFNLVSLKVIRVLVEST